MNKIPKNLDECIETLKKITPSNIVKGLKDGTITSILLHHTLGTWIRNNWKLWGDSDLKKWFEGIGIFHPDDMSGIILTSFAKTLKEESIELKKQVKYYKDYWKKMSKIKKNKDGSCSYNIKINKDGEVEIA